MWFSLRIIAVSSVTVVSLCPLKQKGISIFVLRNWIARDTSLLWHWMIAWYRSVIFLLCEIFSTNYKSTIEIISFKNMHLHFADKQRTKLPQFPTSWNSYFCCSASTSRIDVCNALARCFAIDREHLRKLFAICTFQRTSFRSFLLSRSLAHSLSATTDNWRVVECLTWRRDPTVFAMSCVHSTRHGGRRWNIERKRRQTRKETNVLRSLFSSGDIELSLTLCVSIFSLICP